MHVPAAAIRPRLEVLAQAPVPTKHGVFQMSVFHWGGADTALGLSPDHVAMVMGDVAGKQGVLVRVHSECLTSEVFGSLKCDCRDQLEAAQAEIGRRGAGVVLYLRQEGRGIGLANKLKAYALQSTGHDTVDANRLLGLPDDARDYGAAAAMLEHLGVASVRLMTNNPAKVKALRALGVTLEGRAPSIVGHNPHSAPYLEAKRLRMGHSLPSIGIGSQAALIGDAPANEAVPTES
jgi:GTP cyclohydrolase II